MHAGIRPARTRHPDVLARQSPQRGFQLALNRARVRLYLPTGKIRPVVLQNQFEAAG